MRKEIVNNDQGQLTWCPNKKNLWASNLQAEIASPLNPNLVTYKTK